MIGKEYNEGMKATVNFVQDEDYEEGKRIITRKRITSLYIFV
jgi:hypothetical protein